MFKKLTNLVLVVAVAASVAAGMPLHSRSAQSAMMDCCKKALEQSDSPHVAAARLCCAMNCSEPASTNGNFGQNFSQTGAELSPVIVVALPPLANYKSQRPRYARMSSATKPAYILNLALLI